MAKMCTVSRLERQFATLYLFHAPTRISKKNMIWVFLLTFGSLLLAIELSAYNCIWELFCLQLQLFILLLELFYLKFKLRLFCLQWESVSNKHLNRL